MKKLSLRFAVLPLVAACTSHRAPEVAKTEVAPAATEESGGRAPAAIGSAVPWAPGSPAPVATNPATSAANNNNSYGQSPYPAPGGSPAHGTAPFDPRYPNGSGPNAPGGVPPTTVACTLRFDQVPIGNGYTVLNALQNTGIYGTVTGQWGADQALLRPWFANSQPGSAPYQMSYGAAAWWRALQYVNGNHGNQQGALTYQDYVLGARMASVLVAMMATARDPECVRQIRGYADRVLGPYAQELDALPIVQAAQAVQDRKIGDLFREAEARRRDLLAQLRQQESTIAMRERGATRDRARVEREVQAHYREIRRDLAKLPPCRDSITTDVLTSDPAQPADQRGEIEAVVQACLVRIDDKLDRLTDDEIRAMNELTRIQDRGGLSNVPGSREESLNRKLTSIQNETRKLEGYESMLLRREPSSLTSHFEEIEKILAKQSETAASLPWQAELDRRDEIRTQIAQMAPAWLTYGYFSGGLSR